MNDFLHFVFPGLPVSREKQLAAEILADIPFFGGYVNSNGDIVLHTDIQRLADVALKYDPNQPRAPEGTPTGGQWVGTEIGVSTTLSRDEAIEWSKDSAITTALYHGTSKVAAESIKQNGFRVGSGEQGRLLGRGIYFTERISDASKFGDVLEVRVNVGKVHKSTLSEWVNLRRSMDNEMENSGLNLSKVDTINWWANKNNIDAVIITDKIPQVIIFDPNNIRVVE